MSSHKITGFNVVTKIVQLKGFMFLPDDSWVRVLVENTQAWLIKVFFFLAWNHIKFYYCYIH